MSACTVLTQVHLRELAALLQVLPLLQLLLPEVVAHHRVAMLASHADHAAFPVL